MLLCLGFGYCAASLTDLWRGQGGEAIATSRQVAAGSTSDRIQFNGDETLDVARAIASATHILISIPPDERGDPVLDRLSLRIAEARRLHWLGYLSTTGVYGDRAGAWVDETAALRPASARSRRRAQVEQAWLNLWRERGVPAHIFRLAGIYGPGRSALDQLQAGTARRIEKPGQLFSRIHVEDVAASLMASIGRPRPGSIYNVADDLPAAASHVVAHAASLLGMAPPPSEDFASATLTPMLREFYSECRRVANDRIKRELGVALRYPNYRIGLAAIAAASRH